MSCYKDIRIWDIGVTWRDIHLGVDVYDWSRLDAVVGQIEGMGARITYVVGATPQWLAKDPNQVIALHLPVVFFFNSYFLLVLLCSLARSRK